MESARALGSDVGQRVTAAWEVRPARAPLVALALTLISTFLPWIGGYTLSGLIGWTLPVGGCVVMAVTLVLYVTSAARADWLGVTVVSVSFAMATLAWVVLALLLVLDSLVDSLAQAEGLAGVGARASVGIGGWVMAGSAVVLFITTLRLLLETRRQE